MWSGPKEPNNLTKFFDLSGAHHRHLKTGQNCGLLHNPKPKSMAYIIFKETHDLQKIYLFTYRLNYQHIPISWEHKIQWIVVWCDARANFQACEIVNGGSEHAFQSYRLLLHTIAKTTYHLGLYMWEETNLPHKLRRCMWTSCYCENEHCSLGSTIGENLSVPTICCNLSIANLC